MPTLHDVTDKTKLILRWAGITVAACIVILLLYQGGLFIKNTFFPTKAPPPTALFGKLPPISFPKDTANKKFNYVVDTVTGKLPVFIDEQKKPRDRIKVYTISHNELTLLDLQETKNRVANVGFSGPGIPISENIYRFQKRDHLPKTLDIDIINKNFTVSSSFAFNQEILDALNIPNQSEAISDTTSFARTLGAYPEDIDTTKTKVQLLKLKNGVLFDAEDITDAQIIRVDYFQKDQDLLPIFYPKGIYSSMYFLVGSSQRSESNIVLSNFYHQSITTKNATYKLKPVTIAYDELKEGKGYIAASFVKGDSIKIQDVLLGYYAGNEYQDYLMPIYIFKGREDEFYAYVSAVDNSWIKDDTTSITPVLEQNK